MRKHYESTISPRVEVGVGVLDAYSDAGAGAPEGEDRNAEPKDSGPLLSSAPLSDSDASSSSPHSPVRSAGGKGSGRSSSRGGKSSRLSTQGKSQGSGKSGASYRDSRLQGESRVWASGMKKGAGPNGWNEGVDADGWETDTQAMTYEDGYGQDEEPVGDMDGQVQVLPPPEEEPEEPELLLFVTLLTGILLPCACCCGCLYGLTFHPNRKQRNVKQLVIVNLAAFCVVLVVVIAIIVANMSVVAAMLPGVRRALQPYEAGVLSLREGVRQCEVSRVSRLALHFRRATYDRNDTLAGLQAAGLESVVEHTTDVPDLDGPLKSFLLIGDGPADEWWNEKVMTVVGQKRFDVWAVSPPGKGQSASWRGQSAESSASFGTDAWGAWVALCLSLDMASTTVVLTGDTSRHMLGLLKHRSPNGWIAWNVPEDVEASLRSGRFMPFPDKNWHIAYNSAFRRQRLSQSTAGGNRSEAAGTDEWEEDKTRSTQRRRLADEARPGSDLPNVAYSLEELGGVLLAFIETHYFTYAYPWGKDVVAEIQKNSTTSEGSGTAEGTAEQTAEGGTEAGGA
uniref:Uncharacterized protein n=1 Tax=Chromera velia CCMP2878 TaxID=1169474 RepID=A0A0G4HDI0_9ALVE|eukprot:Cvel_6451.t1-p1 / transcript=Cvel_6451.t1 / gene=Cvel_6451 / organism=Chromera_velia_CCMP2878 / gene_product=hypothetical protein / transcript_product=hypothetical protein / location=Cvel_scaffold316:2945-5961(-) / protein_length=565 / sequence_SO=supercontig / SO=protein_coding / is_pseudo=false